MRNWETRQNNVSRWYENLMTLGDRYLLHGISVEPSSCDCHDGEDFIIPYLNGLIEVLRANPNSHEAQWLEEDKKWIAILPTINGD